MHNRTVDYDTVHNYGPGQTARTTQPGAAGPSSFGFEDIKSYIQPVEEFILKYPGPALASAFLVGVLVAWWIKRK